MSVLKTLVVHSYSSIQIIRPSVNKKKIVREMGRDVTDVYNFF